jgi:predicted NodU family carbamoyl transferase
VALCVSSTRWTATTRWGNYYAYATALCGYKAKRHEGKITGLAARGTPVYKDLLGGMIAHENGRLVNKGRVLFNTALTRIRSRLPEGWTHQDLAASIQVVAEDVARGYVRHWSERTGLRDVALAGGLFANVRINEEIHLLPTVDRTFVHPGMSDEGLAVGAALAMEGERRLARKEPYVPAALPDVYLGTDYDAREIQEAVAGGGAASRPPSGTDRGRDRARLAEGKVVARFHGKMEYGPRPLGNRTILYQPGDPSVNDWLNELPQAHRVHALRPLLRWTRRRTDLYVDVSGAAGHRALHDHHLPLQALDARSLRRGGARGRDRPPAARAAARTIPPTGRSSTPTGGARGCPP